MDDGSQNLFVYGTLRLHMENDFARFLHGASRFLGSGSVRGRLYRVAEYTGLVLSEAPGDPVPGDVFQIDNPDETWPVLDAYEGAEFQLGSVRVALDGGGEVAAVAYLYCGPIDD